MRLEHLNLLRCPVSGREMTVHNQVIEGDRVKSGELVSPSGVRYPVIDFIPRFVDAENYAENFGFEWQLHSRTQYDTDAGHNMSEERLFSVTGWDRSLKGELLLEAGSGSGRFTEHALETGATVVSYDFSHAVTANYASNGMHPNLLLVQANIYEMPFQREAFDKVLCFGVLQHTPDPEGSFKALIPMLKPGGRLASDIYLKTIKRWLLNTRYWVRPFTRNMGSEKLYRWCKTYIDFMWPFVRIVRRIPRFGEMINWRLLIADYYNQMPDASDDILREWAYLDTFDMLSPAYDLPQTPKTFQKWHDDAGLLDVYVRLGPNGVVGTAVKSTNTEKSE